jgi:hypothetical protein
MCPRVGRSTVSLLIATALGVGALCVSASTTGAAAAPTTTIGAGATTTTVAAATSTRPQTTTGVTSTTEAGPQPRESQRVAPVVDIEKIRPVSLPLRTLAIGTAVLIVGLAIAGFVYGKVRSRVPAPATPRLVTEPPSVPPANDRTPAGTPFAIPPPAPLPPPRANPLPPPETMNEWAPPTP